MRLFVAVRPTEQARTALARALRRPADPRWHVTLAFLGEQPAPEPFDLTAATAGHQGFSLRVEGGGTFHGSVLFAGLAGDTEALQHLAEDVRAACRDAGALIEDRPFHPHLTLARGKGLRVAPALREHRGPDWPVTEVELVRSVLGRRARHEVLARFPLAARPGEVAG